jgi:phosphatidylinositol dimannoside acyltransferase
MARDLLAFSPRLRLLVYRLSFFIAEHLPLWMSRTVAYVVAYLCWFFDARGRKTVARNIRHFIPASCSEARRRTVRRCFTNFAFSTCEAFAMGGMPPSLFRPPHMEVIDPWGLFATRPCQRPTVFTTVHCNWELGLALFHHLGFMKESAAVALSHGDPAIDALFDKMRDRFDCRSLLLDRAPLASLRAIKDGRHLCLVGERDYTGNGLHVSFAGGRLRMPVGPAALAVQAGVPIVPCLLGRRSPTRFIMLIGKPLLADASRPKNTQVVEMTQRLADVYARYIAAVPGQWVAFHDAWAD